MPDHVTKQCGKCGKVKPSSEFYRYLKAPDGLFSWCKDCSRESQRRYREASREKMREKDRERYHADPEAARARVRKYREANRDAIRDRERERRNAVTPPDRMCAVGGCEEPRQAKGFCSMHYARYLRNGDPGPAGKKNLPLPDECTVAGCAEVPLAKGLCGMHWARQHKHGDPESGAFRPRGGCDVIGCNRPHAARGYCSRHYWMWRKHGEPEPGGYSFAHRKVYRLRGKASDHACAHCGRPARHWAYDHADPGARVDPRRGGPFSLDPAHYLPLCAACHRILDHVA
jgi:hypothetical protein